MKTDKIGTRIADIASDEKAEAMKRIADILWLDGWTKDDRAQLIEQYDLAADEADAICELLGKIEEAEEAEDGE